MTTTDAVAGERILLLSDVHGNLDALTAVLEVARELAPDVLWVLGDMTGYGPQPGECLDLLRTWSANARVFILGNHDRVVAGLEQPVGFNPHAIAAAHHHRQVLSDEQRGWLASLPLALPAVAPGIGLFHGSPLDPDDYLLTAQSARDPLHALAERHCALGLVGHTHVPAFYELDLGSRQLYDVDIVNGEALTVHHDGTHATIVNPGSVGQPRDGNPASAFAILDLGSDAWTVTFRRVVYDIPECQRKMREAGLPGILAQRLAIGF